MIATTLVIVFGQIILLLTTLVIGMYYVRVDHAHQVLTVPLNSLLINRHSSLLVALNY